MLQLSRSFSLPAPGGIRQAIVQSASYFLDWGTDSISITHGEFSNPLQIAYHDGSTETIPEVSSAFSFTSSDPDGIYYLYKEPSGFGRTRKAPQYRSDGNFSFSSSTEANWNLPLISAMTAAQMQGLEVFVSNEVAPNFGWKLFDRSSGGWLTSANTSTGWLDVYYVPYLSIGGYSVRNFTSGVRRDPSSWRVLDRDTGRILDTRSGITWSGSGQTKQFSLSEPFWGKGLFFEFQSSVSVGGGTQFGLSEIQLFPPLAPQVDWIYSVPDAIARGADGNEKKRVYLGVANLVNSELYEVIEFRIKNVFSRSFYSQPESITPFYHAQGVPREFLSVEVDFPLGSSTGQIVAVDEMFLYYKADVQGLATVSVRRLF